MGSLNTVPGWLGNGDGNGYGDGYGDGYGYGNGNGNGNGDGDGDGDGNGNGYGYGDGYGYGNGNGDGDGYGDGNYWLSTVSQFAAKWGSAQRARLDILKTEGAKIAFWRSTDNGKPANGGKSEAVYPGLVQTERGPLRDDCGVGQLHATLIPPKWQGERYWIVALIGEVRGDDEKMWALKREIIGEAL